VVKGQLAHVARNVEGGAINISKNMKLDDTSGGMKPSLSSTEATSIEGDGNKIS
jgi:hypothetical protein